MNKVPHAGSFDEQNLSDSEVNSAYLGRPTSHELDQLQIVFFERCVII